MPPTFLHLRWSGPEIRHCQHDLLQKYQYWLQALCFVLWCNVCHPRFFTFDDLVQKFVTVNMICCTIVNAVSMRLALCSGVMCATHVTSLAMIGSRSSSLSTWYVEKYQCWLHALCFVFWCNVRHPRFFTYDDLVQNFATVSMTFCRNINADSMRFALWSGVMCATHVSSPAMIWNKKFATVSMTCCRNINAYSMHFALCSGVKCATHVSSPEMIWYRNSPLLAWNAAEISMLTPCALLCVLV